MKTDFSIAILLLGIPVIFLIINVVRCNANEPHIHEYLSNKGASNIVVSPVVWWPSIQSGDYVYDVEYTDRQSQQRRTQCRISAGWLSDGTIYWSGPPEV